VGSSNCGNHLKEIDAPLRLVGFVIPVNKFESILGTVFCCRVSVSCLFVKRGYSSVQT
jgi:hypothetical protein